jgi:eukaryotic-like serine/threonine-protein kinase
VLSPELEGALKVRHLNVCLVNEIHTTKTKYGEIDFLTMELLDGEPLSRNLSKGDKFSASDLIDIARQLCAGLAAAHSAGVIHRDLKSGNVILVRRKDGKLRAVITDFGLAGEIPEPGSVCGTPRYIAPELWLGEKANAASDLYALGVILFELAAGAERAADPVARETRIAGVPEAYSALVAGCLSLEPDRRRQSFQRSLQQDYWKQRNWTRRAVLATGAGAAAAVAAGAWLEKDLIDNLLHPLPEKRFVALMLWPASLAAARALVSGVADAIENELSRAEAFDRNLFAVSSGDAIATAKQIGVTCESLGANLALGVSGIADASQFRLLLTLLDAKSNALLRTRKIVCQMKEIVSMPSTAAREAATLLNISRISEENNSLSSGSTSLQAFRVFQNAEELRKKPNDDGLKAAIENYKAATEADSDYAAAYAKLGVAYTRLYDLDDDPGALQLAQGNAEKAMQLDKNSPDAHLALAFVFEKRGNQDRALDEIHRALELDAGNPGILLSQAQIYARFSRWNEAEQTYGRLRKERPNYWPVYNELGYVLNAQGKYQQAVEAFRAATVAAPGSALAFNNLGALFLKLGDFEKARVSFENSLKLKPSDVAYSNLAEALRAQGQYSQALPLNQKAVALEPSDDQNWRDLADCYAALPGCEKQAHEAFFRAAAEVKVRLQTDPADGSAWIRLALYRAKDGSRRDAVFCLTKAGQFRVTDLDSEIGKARVLEVIGKRDEALAVLADCFRKGASEYEVACIRDFDGLRKDGRYGRIRKPANAG